MTMKSAVRKFLASFRPWLVMWLLVSGVPAWSLEQPRVDAEDPLAWEREPLPASEIGSARGQTHITALGALVSGDNSPDVYLGGKLGIEFLLHEFGGVRISSFQDLTETDGSQLAHKFSSLRFGPALHVSPYRRVDLGPYLEGGIVVVDAVDGRTSSRAPEVALGGFITIYLDSFIFLQLELERAWSVAEVGGVLDSRHRTAALLGLGLAF